MPKSVHPARASGIHGEATTAAIPTAATVVPQRTTAAGPIRAAIRSVSSRPTVIAVAKAP